MLEDHHTLTIIEDIKERSTNRIIIATAESCTGGMLSSALTSIDGSSKFFDRGFITYSNQAKEQILGVKSDTLKEFGAVSEETAGEMAQGCLKNSEATLAISITGIAGPTGGTTQKPVGSVCFGLASPTGINTYSFRFNGSRQEVRQQATIKALELILNYINLNYG